MPLSPPLKEVAKFPLTAVVAIAAAAVSVFWWTGGTIDMLMPSSDGWVRHPGRLASCLLPHGDVVHLLFNLYWWWFFAARIELAWGRVRLIAVVLLLAVSSSALQIGLDAPGVGLSGVGYGLVALLWFAQRTHPVLAGSVSKPTLQLFAAWFVVCIVLTELGVWSVGNVAHASGAAVGGVLGLCVCSRPPRRWVWIGALALLLAAIGAVSILAPDSWRLSSSVPRVEVAAYEAIKGARYDDAERLLKQAIQQRPYTPELWTSLGIAQQHLDRHEEAVESYKQAIGLSPQLRPDLAPAIASILNRRAYDAAQAGDGATALRLAEEVLIWSPEDDYARSLIDAVRHRLSEPWETSPPP